MTDKQKYGQFMTTNVDYILQGIKIPDNISKIIEPFCGEGDLIKELRDKCVIECYDIDPKHKYITKRDTLDNPPNYTNSFIITNPPYLARNKCAAKKLFDKYDVNDLYKCFIKEIITNKPDGGILIIPLNFWSSIRKSDIQLRKDFLNVFEVIIMNIFNEQVFDDTSYTVCSFLFEIKKLDKCPINITIFPSKKKISVLLSRENNYTIGGEIYNIGHDSQYNITRITSKNAKKCNTNILVKCIDDNKNSMIGLSIVDDDNIYVDNTPNQSARTYASLIIEPPIDLDTQKKLVNNFNKYLNDRRDKYDSLFLTNYRESKDIARKRISFELVYNIIKHLLK